MNRQRHPWRSLAALCLAVFLVVIDNTIVNVALPTLSIQLHASNTALQWIVDGYALPFAGLLLAGGDFAERYGRRRTMHVALASFALFSFAAAECTTIGWLLAARACMGASAAFIFPATLSLVSVTFPDPRQRTKAFGIWGAVVGVAIALGPIAGGYLLNHYWYGSVFLVSVPVALLAIAATFRWVGESHSPDARTMDIGGLAFGVTAVTLLTLGIIQGPSWGWRSPVIVAIFVVFAVLGIIFVRYEKRREGPLLDVSVFRNRTFSSAAAAIATSFFCLFGFIFVVTQYFQLIRGYSPLAAGIHTLPFAVVTALVTPLGALAALRIGTRWVVSGGLVIMGSALGWMATLNAHAAYVGPVILSMMVLAFGFSLISSPSTSALMNALSARQIGAGAAVNETTREVGGTLGVAVMGSVFSSLFGPHIVRALSPLHLPTALVDAARSSMQATLSVLHGLPPASAAQIRPLVVDAFMSGFHRACIVASVTTILLGLVVFWFLPGPLPQGEGSRLD